MNQIQPLTVITVSLALLCSIGLKDRADAQVHSRLGKVGPVRDLSDVPLNRPSPKLDLDDEIVYEFFPSFLGLGSPGARQIRTRYFLINFVGAETTARRVAEIADDAFEQITQHYPGSVERFAPIHVFVTDGSDVLGNAFASPSHSFVMFWASPFDIEQRGSSDWVRNVFTHELTHVITWKAVHNKLPFEIGVLAGSESNSNPDYRFVLPIYHAAFPMWFSEGVAQFESKEFGGDSWDTHRDMLLRTATLEKDLLPYTSMGSFSGKDSFHGEMVYNQGFALLNYVEAVYGDEKVRAMLDHRPIVNFKSSVKKTLGISADRLYADWVIHLEEKYGAVADSVNAVGEREGERIFDKGSYEFYPTYSPDGSKVAFITNNGEDYKLNRLVVMDLSTRKLQTVAKWNQAPYGLLSTRFSWAPDGKRLFFVRSVGGRWDIFSYDLEQRKEKRVTIGLRGKDPAISPDGTQVAFVGHRDGTNSLGILRIDSTRVRHLTQNNDGTLYFGPKWSPDGKRILFTVFRGEDRDIAIIDADATPRPRHRKRKRDKEAEDDSLTVFPDTTAYANDAGFEALLRSSADERDPVWLPDGSGFVFSSDRTGIFNLYGYDFVTGRQAQITNVTGGAFVPTISPDGQEIIYAGFHAADYSLYRIQTSVAVPVPAAEALRRDYSGIYTGDKLSDLYDIGRYSGRITPKGFGIVPILALGPTFIGNRFGLDQISFGAQASWGEFLGSDMIVAGFSVGKNLRRRTDLNSDLYAYYEKGLRALETEHKSYRPTFFTGFNRTTINSLIDRGAVLSRRDTTSGTLVTVIDSQQVIIPNTTQHLHLTLAQEDDFKDVFNDFVLGFEFGVGSGPDPRVRLQPPPILRKLSRKADDSGQHASIAVRRARRAAGYHGPGAWIRPGSLHVSGLVLPGPDLFPEQQSSCRLALHQIQTDQGYVFESDSRAVHYPSVQPNKRSGDRFARPVRRRRPGSDPRSHGCRSNTVHFSSGRGQTGHQRIYLFLERVHFFSRKDDAWAPDVRGLQRQGNQDARPGRRRARRVLLLSFEVLPRGNRYVAGLPLFLPFRGQGDLRAGNVHVSHLSEDRPRAGPLLLRQALRGDFSGDRGHGQFEQVQGHLERHRFR